MGRKRPPSEHNARVKVHKDMFVQATTTTTTTINNNCYTSAPSSIYEASELKSQICTSDLIMRGISNLTLVDITDE